MVFLLIENVSFVNSGARRERPNQTALTGFEALAFFQL
jgi:hypothetical protein